MDCMTFGLHACMMLKKRDRSNKCMHRTPSAPVMPTLECDERYIFTFDNIYWFTQPFGGDTSFLSLEPKTKPNDEVFKL